MYFPPPKFPGPQDHKNTLNCKKKKKQKNKKQLKSHLKSLPLSSWSTVLVKKHFSRKQSLRCIRCGYLVYIKAGQEGRNKKYKLDFTLSSNLVTFAGNLTKLEETCIKRTALECTPQDTVNERC